MAIPRFPQGPFTQGSGPDQTEVLSPPYPRTPGVVSGTSTLAQVLAAGNDPNQIGIIAATVAGGTGAELDVFQGAGGTGGGITALSGDGIVGQAGGDTLLAGGAGNGGANDGATVLVHGGGAVNPGRVTIYTNATAGAAGQELQADGAGGTTWVTPAAATAPGVVGDIVAETLPSAAAAGAVGKYADAGHRHAIAAAGAPVAEALGSTAVTGAAGTFADSAHRHAMPAKSIAVPLVESGAGSAGVSANPALDDHVHPAATPVASSCRAINNGVQSIADSVVFVVLGFNTDEHDDANYHFTSAANLTGTVTKTATSAAIVGVGTAFLTELAIGQMISVPGTAAERRIVTAITDDTHLTVNTAFANTAAGQTATRVNSPFVAVVAGTYQFTIYTSWDTNIVGRRILTIGKNLVQVAGTDREIPASTAGAQATHEISATLKLALWDYLEALVYQNSGGARDAGAATGGKSSAAQFVYLGA